MLKYSNGKVCFNCGHNLNKMLLLYNHYLDSEKAYLMVNRCGLCGQLNMYLVDEPLNVYLNKNVDNN